MKQRLLGKTPEELKEIVREAGLPKFAAGQIAKWLYGKKVRSIDGMTDISKAGRAVLAGSYEVGVTPYSGMQVSSDGTKKYLFPVEGVFSRELDGAVKADAPQYGAHPATGTESGAVEAVMIPDGERATLCVSSQSGCRMGCRFCMTGRQALAKGYGFLIEQLSEEKTGKNIFLSLSIAPLFPYGMGHARRFSCDAFGTAEDTEYVLNALTYAWWQNGTLYCYNDPDHISLYRSFACDRRTTFGEAKARYTSAAISGTIMMISEDFGEAGKELSRESARARQRAEKLCRNREIREIAASGISFRPAESAGTGAARWYTARIGENNYVAVFHLKNGDACCRLELEKAGIRGICQAEELWSGIIVDICNDILSWTFKGVDAAVFRLKGSETQVPSCY